MSVTCNAALAAQNAKPAFGSGNSKAPIEISADALEVLQEQNKAVFTGHVVAIQDKMRIKSDKMTVFYRNGEAQQPGQDGIRRIEVEGSVFMTTPEETASGRGGVYDVEKNHITLTDNVVLTRGKNTLKGDRLVYDMATGKSAITSGGSVASEQKSGKKERVRALFIPDEKQKKGKAP